MIRQIASFLGRHLLRRTVGTGVQQMSGGAIDPKFGLRLLRDARVPNKTKVLALGLGLGAVMVLEILELPLQLALTILLPFFGLAADLAIDGVELLAGPLLVASLTLPWLAPREVVEEIRAEHEGRVYQPVSANIS